MRDTTKQLTLTAAERQRIAKRMRHLSRELALEWIATSFDRAHVAAINLQLQGLLERIGRGGDALEQRKRLARLRRACRVKLREETGSGLVNITQTFPPA